MFNFMISIKETSKIILYLPSVKFTPHKDFYVYSITIAYP